jgi:Flp pilus assembly protein TadB
MNADLSLIVAVVGSAFATVLGLGALVVSMFFWIRSEANTDRRELDSKFEEGRRETQALIKSMNEAWLNEQKDFHRRLFELEKSKR